MEDAIYLHTKKIKIFNFIVILKDFGKLMSEILNLTCFAVTVNLETNSSNGES